MGFCSLSLLLPQPGQACGGAEFPGLGLLLLSDLDGFEKALLRLRFSVECRGRKKGCRV